MTASLPPSPASAPAPLRAGMLRAVPGQRHLTLADGTPFFWLGDTAWNTACLSTPDEWREYVDARARQGFTLLQVHALQTKETGALTDRDGNEPFRSDGAPNPFYWNALQQKVRGANDRGLAVLLAGVGAGQQELRPDSLHSEAFVRYLVELFADDAVIFSPSMDRAHDPRNDAMARRLKALSPRHLVTQHPNNTLSPALAYHANATLDLTLYQSGHANGNADVAYAAAFDYPAQLLKRPPCRPVINSEAMYDGSGADDDRAWTGRTVRQLGWISLLCGSAGYTYGAGETRFGGRGGVWKFNRDENSFDYWRRALEWPSAAEMGHLARFFRAFPWWRLTPCAERVVTPETAPRRRIAAAEIADARRLLAFLPDHAGVTLDLAPWAGPFTARWFDPLAGSWHPAAARVEPGRAVPLRAPARGEWVLSVQPEEIRT